MVCWVQDMHTQIDRFPSERITVLLAQSCSVNLDTGRGHKIQTGTGNVGQKINVFLLALNKTGNNELKMELRFFLFRPWKSMEYIFSTWFFLIPFPDWRSECWWTSQNLIHLSRSVFSYDLFCCVLALRCDIPVWIMCQVETFSSCICCRLE